MGNKVIEMNTNGDMKARIEQAAQKAEEEFQEKVKQSRACDVDVRDFFSDEELDRILSDNNFFNGKVADLTKIQRHEKLSLAAKWMKAHSYEVVDMEIEPTSPSHPNAVITMDFRRLATLRDQEQRVFTLMNALADNLYISAVKEDVIRFTFIVEGVWR